ncbi:unnamed protein product [Eruca vesicaria subsp. sativa]|uniref:KIB1-4 beta-propeller domain-containing protein n=1 Tax=Eruca vesicaria subsp. sativa TaxID=29727 RepID=A0ABC8JFC6_ERUVS|nr:unnamed protein product [Eruca vesicaria subsp. sativa]
MRTLYLLDTEARIWEWRQAIKFISSKSGLSNENSSDPVFFTDVVTKVKELFEFKDRPKKPSYNFTNQMIPLQKQTCFEMGLVRDMTLYLVLGCHATNERICLVIMMISSSLSSPDLGQSLKRTLSGSLGLMLFPKDGGFVLYNPKEGSIQRNQGDFSGCRFLANSGNWLLVLDSVSNLFIIDVFSEKKILLPSLESIESTDSTVKRVGDRVFERHESDSFAGDLSSDVVRGLLWVSESGKEYVVVWLFDLPGHSYISFCKNGDTHYTDIPLFYDRTCTDLSGQQGFFTDITGRTPFPMLSRDDQYDSSIAVTRSGEVLLVESDPYNRTWFRLYKKDPDLENPETRCHTVVEVDSLGGEALLLDLGFTVPANKALGIEPDCIYFTRHFRPCHCTPRDLDICVFNLATKTLVRFPDLDMMNIMDARWFLPRN